MYTHIHIKCKAYGKSATTVRARDILLASEGNLTSSPEMSTTWSITALTGRTGDNLEFVLAGTATPYPAAKAEKTTAKEAEQKASQEINKCYSSRSTSHTSGRHPTRYNTN